MLIIRKNQTNNLIATVSMNKTLANPYYLFSFQHIASKERYSFIPQTIVSNTRYDKFRFAEGFPTNLNLTPPQVHFEYLGQYYYSIYEQVSSANTDPSLAFNKLESGRAVVIIGNDNLEDCYFEPYISDDENFAQVIYVSDDETICVPSVTPTSTPTNTPSVTPTLTPGLSPTPSETPTLTPTNTPSNTPTLTPTPSSSPVPTINPATLGATWWSQYSNSAFLNLVTPGPITPVRTYQGYIASVIDGVDGSTFFQNASSSSWWNPAYSSCTPNFSGAMTYDAYATAGIMRTQNGDYTGNTTDFTFFIRLNVQPRLGFTEEIINVSDTSYGQPVRWYQIKIPTFGGIEIDVWADPDTASGFLNINNGIAYNTWLDLAVRSYQDGPDYKIEYWTGNTIVASASITYTAVPTTAAPAQQIGPMIESIAEASWWNRKLTDSEMGDMFTFLNNRYC